MKEKTIIKISMYSIIIFLIIIAIVIFKGITYISDDKDFCLDTGICKTGLEVNTEYGLIEINKENCIRYNWEWIEESKMCNMK